MAEGSELLSKVDALLERSRKFKLEGRTGLVVPTATNTNLSYSASCCPGGGVFPSPDIMHSIENKGIGQADVLAKQNRAKIMAAMSQGDYAWTGGTGTASSSSHYNTEKERLQSAANGARRPSENLPRGPVLSELRTPAKAVDSDLIGLAARYGNEIDVTLNLSYRQKVELEELESLRNDLRMKNEILEKKLHSEAQRLLEKEVSLSKVLTERDAQAKSVSFLSQELQNMNRSVEEGIRELRDSDKDVIDEMAHEKELFQEISFRIEKEKQEFLIDLKEEFEDEQREKIDQLSRAEAETAAAQRELEMLKDIFAQMKTDIAHQLHSLTESVRQEEVATTQRLEAEIGEDFSLVALEIEDLKKQEMEARKMLAAGNSKLEETRVNATKTIAALKVKQQEYRSEYRTVANEERHAHDAFTKKQHQYESLYSQAEKEEADLQRLIVKHGNEIAAMRSHQEEECMKIEAHIQTGQERLEKIEFAIGEFSSENVKLREKNKRTVDNLKMGLDDLVRGIADLPPVQ